MTVARKSKRIFYFDALRALAILSVIFFHVSTRMVNSINSYYTVPPNFHWIIGASFFACTVIGVDLFLMLSGALSLGREWSIKTFLGKRLPRIVLPFLFWGFILSFVLLLSQYFLGIPHFVESFSIKNILLYVYGAFNSTSYGFGPYWFFWMILGTYLIMPVLNKWLLHSDLYEAEYFLVFWLISCIFDFTINYPFPVKISYFSGPIGMVVLGYYLRHTKREIFTKKYIPFLLILLGFISVVCCSYFFSSPNHLFKFERYSIFIAMEVAGIFLLFRNFLDIDFENNSSKLKTIMKKFADSMAKYSYGLYLIHLPIMTIIIALLKINSLYVGYFSRFVFLFISTLLISWIIMALLNKINLINQVIGAK
ncbi:acyltransferase [uncultured Methanobrevibacter sp.]|uniref:acyltransferase n=1 Tax=uncultured Methanobrevibacter sp. TaxID=253161 RepID=UPI002625425A